MPPTRSTLHRRISHFVDWIRPDEAREAEIRAQADQIRKRLTELAHADGLTVRSTPQAGSFAKNTGLRRHITGGSEVEGLDVDVHFIVGPDTRAGDQVDQLLLRFERYARKEWPQNQVSRTRSSVSVQFVRARLSYDLVPLIATENPEWQLLRRADGTTIRTSVQRHVELIKSRTRDSNGLPGRPRFNECVRLMKWWREFRLSGSGAGIVLPSLLIDLLCASAYDHEKVKETYHETLLDWFGYLYGVVSRRERVVLPETSRHPAIDRGVAWEVIDAVTPENNAAKGLSRAQVDQLGAWLRAGRETLQRAVEADRGGHDTNSLGEMAQLFGAPFKHHCEGT